MLSGGYVQLKIDWDFTCYLLSSTKIRLGHSLLFTEFKDTNDEAV